MADIPTVYAKSTRLTLRDLCQLDIAPIQRYLSDFDVSKWTGTIPYPLPDEYSREYIERSLTKHKLNIRLNFAIVENESQTIVGAIGCWPLHDQGYTVTDTDQLEIGYWLGKDYWHRGYATEAVRLMIEYIYYKMDSDAILMALYQPENVASINVLQKVGFVPIEGAMTMGNCVARGHSVQVASMQLTRVEYMRKKLQKDAVSFSSIPIVETKRLQVRHLNPTDAPLIQRYFNEWEVTKWLTRLPYPYTDADANEFIEHRSKFNKILSFGIVEKQQNILIGGFDFSPSIDSKQTSIEIAYWIGYEYWHRGYATEAVQEMIAYLYRQFGSNCELIASHFTENAASANVLRKLGFTYMSENCEFMLESISRKHAVPALRMHLLVNRHKCENMNDIEKLEENKLASA